MKPRELTRRHLEALVVARAVVSPDPAEILARVDPLHVSPAVIALLEQLADPEMEAIQLRTKGQRELADRAEAITLAELLFFRLDTLLSLVNQLPAKGDESHAWERDLAVGLAQETAA